MKTFILAPSGLLVRIVLLSLVAGVPLAIGCGSTEGRDPANTGDATATGGNGATTSTGGTTGAGGTSVGNCNRPVSSCSSPEVTVTEIDMGVPITGYGNENDLQPLPLAIAARPSGGSLVAARGTDGQITIGELDCDDNLVGTPFSLPGENLQDLHADAEGGVVMLTRAAMGEDAEGHGCGTGPLCGGTSDPCRNSLLVRFDNAGNPEWETPVTNLDEDLDGYNAGARFIWQKYQHHGRIAFDGENYAAYFCIGITVDSSNAEGYCVDIHEGDRMQVVDSSGNLVSDHPDSFQVGCSHSWTTRIVWDPRESRFVMVCATDNACRIAQPGYHTIAEGECDGTLFGGDVVLSSTPGYWTAWSQGGQIRLEHFTDENPSDTTIMDAGASMHPHLVSHGAENMLLSWESGEGMAAQLRDAGTGETVGPEFTIDVPDHDFQAFKAYPDGSAAYAAAGSTDTRVRIARVMPCGD